MNRINRISRRSNSLKAREPFRIPHLTRKIALRAASGSLSRSSRLAFRIEKRPKASSLITTLLVLVVLSTIVVAFMQSMSVERNVARSAKNKLQAQLAAESGLAAALKQLTIATGTNQAYVVGQTNDAANFGPILVIAQKNLTNIGELMPLISGDISSLSGYPTNTNNGPAVLNFLNARTNLAPTASINLNLENKLIHVTNGSNYYRAPWVYLTDADGKTNGRYAYIVLDEWARVNPRHHGIDTPRNHPTNWFSGPRELPLSTGGSNLFTTNDAAKLTNIAPFMITSHTMGQAFSTAADYQQKKHLLTANEIWSPDVIPAELPEGGKPKYNINDLATNSTNGASATERADKIAGIISTNLPQFGKRDLGLQIEDPSGLKYLKRLAANIVDYIDADNVPTTVNGGEPAGKELTPYIVMTAEKNTWVSESAGPPYTIVIKSEFYAQLWNPCGVPVSGNVTVEIKNRQYIDLRNGNPQIDLADFTSTPTNVTLLPNEFKAVSLGSTQQNFTTGPTSLKPSSNKTNYPTWPTTSSKSGSLTGHPQFRYYWNNNLADMNRTEPENVAPASAGLVRSGPGNAFGGLGEIRWSFNWIPGGTQNSPNTVGDPRITFISQSDWAGAGAANTGHTNGFWQGRQSDLNPVRTQNFNSIWETRDYVRSNTANQGTALASNSGDPTAISTKYSTVDATNYIAVVRNQSMQSIGELGHIFDPIQVDNTGSNSYHTDNGYVRPGGAFTLRIGQPELKTLGTNGSRAIELVDIFTVNRTNAISTNYSVTRGRININTAPQAVIEALFYNIKPASDGAYTNCSISSATVSNVAQSLITNRPYNRLSDLYKLAPALVNSTNYSPALGTTNLPSNVLMSSPAADVFDRAREEAFGKVVELCTVQSRGFRVYIVGQSLGSNLKRHGQAVIETSISMETTSSNTISPKVESLRWDN